MKVWYGGPGQLENLRDVEAGLLREDSGEKEEDDKEEVKTMMVLFMVELADIIFVTSSTSSANVKYFWICVKLYRINTLTTLLEGKYVNIARGTTDPGY